MNRGIAIVLGPSKAGLTDLVYQLTDVAGDPYGDPVEDACVEIGGGNYHLPLWLLSNFTGGVKIYSAQHPDTVLAFAAIDADDILTNLNLLALKMDGLDVSGGTAADGHYRLLDLDQDLFARLATLIAPSALIRRTEDRLRWTITITAGPPEDYWQTEEGASLLGPYTAQGGAEGVPMGSWHLPARQATLLALPEVDAAAVWSAARRTLTGTGGAVGPTAGANLAPIPCGPIPPGQTLDLSACVSYSGEYATVAATASIAYTIYASHGHHDATAVPGHTGVSLTPASVLYDTLQTDGEAANWNFRFRPSPALGQPFPQAGHYLVAVVFTVGDQEFYCNFHVDVRW